MWLLADLGGWELLVSGGAGWSAATHPVSSILSYSDHYNKMTNLRMFLG